MIKQYNKLKGSGLPTLLTKGAFSFDTKAEVNEYYKNKLETDIAVNIICDIIKNKLNNTGIKNRLYFLQSRTGSGKSTTFIYNLFLNFINNSYSKIMVTEPRVPLCEANANEIVRWSTNNDKMGVNVGYITGPAKLLCNSTKGQLYYCTPQILANQLNNLLINGIDENNYTKIVVIDEAHLLDMPTLETLNIVYNVLEKFKNDRLCPLIIFASATLNIEPFLKYFIPLFNDNIIGSNNNNKTVYSIIPNISVNNNEKDNYNIIGSNNNITIEDIYKDYSMIGYVSGGANFTTTLNYVINEELNKAIDESSKNIDDPVKNKHLFIVNYSNYISKFIVNNYIGKMMSTIKENGNDLLLFVPKSSIINNVVNSIVSIMQNTTIDNTKIPVFGIVKNVPFQDVEQWRNQNRNINRLLVIGYGRGFAPASDELLKTSLDKDLEAREYERKIFISTPIIETGKTIASLRYCIDTGLELKPCPNPLIYNPYRTVDNLKLVPINQSAATQRYGRVGREQTGECLRYYTLEDYNKLDHSELPETINNYCLSAVILSKIQTLQPFTYFNIFNENNYLYKISLDIQLRTICDLINAGFYNIFGYVTNLPFDIDRTNILTNYIQQLYYINNLSLFESLLTINLNMKYLSNELTPINVKIDSLPIKLNELHKKPIDIEMIDNIKKSRNVITNIIYDSNYTIFKYLYNRLF